MHAVRPSGSCLPQRDCQLFLSSKMLLQRLGAPTARGKPHTSVRLPAASAHRMKFTAAGRGAALRYRSRCGNVNRSLPATIGRRKRTFGVVCSPSVTETFQKSGCRAYTVTEEAQPE